jgi:membrane fusion protein, multidrug efflux system
MDQKTDTKSLERERTRPQTKPDRTIGDKPPKRGGSTRWVLFLLALLGAGAAYYYFYLPGQTPQPASAQREHKHGFSPTDAPQPVGVATAVTGDIRIIADQLGTVTPLATVTVKTQINGYLQSVAFKEGQYVKQGDFLAQIDPRPFQVAEQQFEGQLIHDQGTLDQARADLIRFQTLMKQDSIAKQQAENQVYVVKQSEGSVKSDQAQVDAQRLNLTYCHMISPVTGRVGLRQVDPGNYVQTSDPNGIVIVTQLDPISVIFTVPEDLLPQITEELNADHELTTFAYDRANVRLLATGHVTVLDNEVDTTTGTVKLRAEFANPDQKLFPMQFVNVRLLIRTVSNVVTVPNPAIQRGAPGTYVYLVDGDDKVTVRQVKVGPIDGDKVQIESGLVAGDRVVIDGSDRLRDGARITIPSAANTPPPAAEDPAKSGEHEHKGKWKKEHKQDQ